MSGAWDDDDFDPEAGFDEKAANAKGTTDKWADEDDEDVKEAWDASDEEKEKAKPEAEQNGEVRAVQKKKKRPLKEIIAEKEAKKAAEEEEARRKEAEPVDAVAEKLRLRHIQEESDRKLALEAFGGSEPACSSSGLDAMNPTSAEEFTNFATALTQKITHFEKSSHYTSLLDALYRDCAINLDAEELKKLGGMLTSLGSEKAKAQKASKAGKKTKNKAKITQVRDNDYGETMNDGGYDEFDDFL